MLGGHWARKICDEIKQPSNHRPLCFRQWHAMGEKFKSAMTCPITCRDILLLNKSEDNPIERARIDIASRPRRNSTGFFLENGLNLQELFTKDETLLIRSKPSDALEVLDAILDIDSQN
jgi:hypothetical protein